MANNTLEESIIFLGTGGARVMVANQFLASGGIWLKLAGTELLLDPGPGSIVQATKRKLRTDNLSAVILSHRHLDHSGDTNIMVEAMTQGGFKPHGWLYAPADALGEEPVLYSYLRRYLDGVGTLEEGGTYAVDGVSFETPLRHIHPVETYGITFRTPQHTFSYIADSRYFDGLGYAYPSELLIINVVFRERNPLIDHLSVGDAALIINRIRPKAAILTHFGMHVWKADPEKVAKELAGETGTRVVAARDGMKFDLSELDED